MAPKAPSDLFPAVVRGKRPTGLGRFRIGCCETVDYWLGELIVVAGRHQAAADTATDGVGNPSYGKCYRWCAVSRGFEGDHAEAFIVTRPILDREDVHVSGEIRFAYLRIVMGPGTKPTGGIGEAIRFQRPLDPVRQGLALHQCLAGFVADDDKARVGDGGEDPRQAIFHERRQPLAFRDPADIEHDGTFAQRVACPEPPTDLGFVGPVGQVDAGVERTYPRVIHPGIQGEDPRESAVDQDQIAASDERQPEGPVDPVRGLDVEPVQIDCGSGTDQSGGKLGERRGKAASGHHHPGAECQRASDRAAEHGEKKAPQGDSCTSVTVIPAGAAAATPRGSTVWTS